VQTIKSPDASRRKWISASGRVFCSRTFGMYYMYHDGAAKGLTATIQSPKGAFE